MATTIDGFIANKDGNSDWVSPVDTDNFMSQIHNKGCIIVGSTTFHQYLDELYPVDGVINIVLSSKEEKSDDEKKLYFLSRTPHEVVEFLESRGQHEALLIGGGITNAIFLEAGLIDEVILTVHPMILGNGIKLFNGKEIQKNFVLTDVKKLPENLVQLYYKTR